MSERLFRALGYGYSRRPEMPDENYPGMAVGHMVTETSINFGLPERIRILFSGNIFVSVCTKTEQPVEGKTFSQAAVSVLAPGAVKRQ